MKKLSLNLDDRASCFVTTSETEKHSEASRPLRREAPLVVAAILADSARDADRYVKSYDAGSGAE